MKLKKCHTEGGGVRKVPKKFLVLFEGHLSQTNLPHIFTIKWYMIYKIFLKQKQFYIQKSKIQVQIFSLKMWKCQTETLTHVLCNGR